MPILCSEHTFDQGLKHLEKAFRHFLNANKKKTFFGCKKKALSDFLSSSSSRKIANNAKPAYNINQPRPRSFPLENGVEHIKSCRVAYNMLKLTWLRIFRDTLVSILVLVNENFCLYKCFTEFYFFYWLLVVFLAIFFKSFCWLFSRTWTSLAGVLKMPRVLNTFKD